MYDSAGWLVYTGGTHTDEDGKASVMAMANWAFGDISDPNVPVSFGVASVPMTEDSQSVAVAMTSLATAVYWKNLTCVLGNYWRDENPGYQDCIVGGFGFWQINGTFVHLDGPGASWPYVYTEGLPRNHSAVAIDGGWHGDPFFAEPRVVVAIHSSSYTYGGQQHSADSTVVVLNELGDELARITLPEKVTDVRLDLEHVWILSEHSNGSLLIRAYDESLTTLAVHQTFSLPNYICSARLLRHLSNGAGIYDRINGEFVIAGTRTPTAGGNTDILLLRFGWDDVAEEWAFLWPAQIYDNGGYDQPMDVGAVYTIDGVGPDNHTVVYIAAQSESSSAASEFTTLCYRETSSGVGLEWEARHSPGYVGAAFSLSGGTQDVAGDKWVIAIVSGAVDDSLGYWDWMTVKYNHGRPPVTTPPTPKTPRWEIRYPVVPENPDDMVAVAVTHFIADTKVAAFATGTTMKEDTGVDILTTWYEETSP
jgi:hypothetical protein